MLAPRAAPVALAVLAVVAWLLGPLGVSAAEAARALLVLALATLPWGLLLTRGATFQRLLPGERAVMAALVGYPVAAALYYVFSLAGSPGLFLPASGTAALLALALRTREPSAVTEGEAGSAAKPHWSLALFVPIAILVATRWSRPFTPGDGGLLYTHSVDHSLHLAFYWELLRGVPAEQLPTAAGVPFPAYHFLAFMPGMLMLDAADIPVTVTYHVLSPFLKLLLLLGAIYLAVRIRTDDGRAATAAVPAFFVAAYAFEAHFNDRFVVGPPPHYDFLRNEAEGGGLVVWAAIVCLLALSDRVRSLGAGGSWPLTLACLLAGLSFGFKAQLFVLLGAALVLALLLRERSRRTLSDLLLMGLVCGGLFWLAWRPGSPTTTLEWRPGLFAELYVYPNLRRDPWPWVRALGGALETLPAALGSLAAIPLALLRVSYFSPLVPAFLWLALRRPRELGLLDAFAAAAFVLALPMGYGLSFAFLHWAASPFEFRQAAHGLSLLAVLISVVALFELLHRRGRPAGSWVLAGSALLCLVSVPTLLREQPYVPARATIVLPADEQCALLFLRRRTAPDSVVLSSRGETARRNHHAVVAGFAGRRSVLEFYEGGEVDPGNDRERDIRRFYATPDDAVAARILGRYRVDYVLESDALPMKFSKAGLEPAFENGRFRVWRVAAAVSEPAPAVPEVFTRADELSCAALH